MAEVGPDGESDTGGEVVETSPSKHRTLFSRVTRRLTEEELLTPAGLRFLLDESERLHTEAAELQKFRDRYYQAEKARAILEQKLRVSLAQDVTFGLCLSVGTLLWGVAPSIWGTPPFGLVLMLVGATLILCGIIAKALQR